ncbi:MAG TPA: Hsp20/alpha crystallin family protein [Casimicrobiaceae bacterium]|jgi:HSP20 family molecular chaperone IbpA
MPLRDPGSGFFAEALELLREADRVHRRFFTLPLGQREPCWEPPVDIVERDRVLVIRVALPGVPAAALEVSTDGASLRVIGMRRQSAAPGDTIHRLEIPYGRFERRVALPPGRFDLVGRDLVDGCLVLSLRRIG